ncbi:MAG TPA: DNA translocase FtsK 4TM domain-containing protein [Ilumatobacter sp.]|nr:DNA translocase FtsK 4TM domain-containing protein [Ilumatobacter sp.]
MNTWGPSKKPRAQSSNRSDGSGRNAPKPGSGSKSSSKSPPKAPRVGTRDLTPPNTRRRDATPTELRNAVAGKEHDLVGVVLIGVGAVLALAMYFDLGGPLGRALDTFVGWFFGLARYVLPIVLVAIGIAFIRKGRSSSPLRLVLGWGLVAAAALGLLHVIRNPDSFTDMDALGEGGGWLGAVLVEPIATLIARPGAVVVMLALGVGGAALITQTSLRTMAMHTGRGVGAVAKPLGHYTKRALSDLSTLSSEREGGRQKKKGKHDNWGDPGVDGVAGEPLSPALYDGAEHDDELYGSSGSAATADAKRRRRSSKPGADQSALPIDGKQLGEWALPPLSFLKQAGQQAVNMNEIEKRGVTLQESLASHGVETQLVGMTVGPTVTRYELELGAGVKVARVTSLQRDIAYAMAAVDVRILAPIPGRSAIGVEVPNHKRQLVALGDLLVSKEAAEASHPLEVGIGKDIAGRAVFLDISTTPHLLIAGATGAGKSSALNCIITSLLMRSTPDHVRLILIDPKQVEMGQYQRLPHLLTQPVTNPKKAANALGWAVKEMDRRYDVLSEVGFRDITGYNAAVVRGDIEPPPGVRTEDSPYEHMPFIVVVVDELNDLMMVAARDVEESITRIAQKARAVGIHLIVATQRPSVNVITGVIKANIPARMAFAVSSLTDSRVILDQPGAEKLVGKGDMLLLPGNSSVPHRIQGAFVSEDEVRKVVTHWRRQAPEPIYSSNVEGDVEPRGAAAGGMEELALDVTSDSHAFSSADEDDDAVMMRQAMEHVVRSQLGSTSMLQRKLKIGFARAGRIMDLLEQRGVVGPSEGSKAREVLMTVEEFELLQEKGQL